MPDVGKFFGSLFGSAAGGAVSPASTMVEAAQKILGMFKLDATEKAKIEAQLTQDNVDITKAQLAADVAAMQGQLEINKQEAASTSMFIAGWRPAVGWVCVVSLGYAYVIEPFLKFAVALHHPDLVSKLPTLDTGSLLGTLLVPLLGLAGFRTFEKLKGVEGNR